MRLSPQPFQPLSNLMRAATVAIIVLLVQPTYAATYYVAKSGGSDSNSGSTSSPWASMKPTLSRI